MGTKQNFRSWFQPPWHFVSLLPATFLGAGELNGEGQGRMAASVLEEGCSSQVPYPTAEPGPRSLAHHLGGSQSVAKSARTAQALLEMDITAQVGFGAHASPCTRLRTGRGFITDTYVAASLNAARHLQVFLPVDKVLVHSLL